MRIFGRLMLLSVGVVLCLMGCDMWDDNPLSGGYDISLSCGDRACRTVTIGDQTWMAENLNYEPSSGNSWCYDDKISNCNKYGKLYDWATAMGISTSYNKQKWEGSDVKHRGICPEGWHLPSNKEWNDLKDYVGNDAGYKLRATSGWYKNGVDTYGFSALPGGMRSSTGKFYAGDEGYWWTATDTDWKVRNIGSTGYQLFDVIGPEKSSGRSVRCVKN